MTRPQSLVYLCALIVSGSVYGTVAAQSDTAQRLASVSVAAAEAVGVKLLGVFDANTGEWLVRAVVRDTLGRETVTSDGGVAALSVLQPVLGQYMLEIRKEGYAPKHFKLRADTAAEFLVSLTPNPLGQATALPTMITTDRRRMLEEDAGMKAGFFTRCQMASVECVGQRDLDLRPTGVMSDLISHQGGISLQCPPKIPVCVPRMKPKFGPGYCTPTYFVNGFIWTSPSGVEPHLALDQFLNATSIDGIELYLSGMPRPAKWDNQRNDCGAIVIWTRPRTKAFNPSSDSTAIGPQPSPDRIVH